MMRVLEDKLDRQWRVGKKLRMDLVNDHFIPKLYRICQYYNLSYSFNPEEVQWTHLVGLKAYPLLWWIRPVIDIGKAQAKLHTT